MIAVTTESTADIQPIQVGYSGINLVPVPLGHQDRVYSEHDLNPQDFVDMIRRSGQPAVTMPIPDDTVAKTFEDALQKSASGQLLHVASGSRFTPHFGVATRVAEQFGGRVTVVDSGTVSYALGVQALHAAHLSDQKAGLNEILAAIRDLRERTLLSFAVENLDFLRFNGRVSNFAALIGNWLDVRPVLAVETGEVVNKARVRGQDAAVKNQLIATYKFQKELQEPLRMYCGHTIGGEDTAREFSAQLRLNYPSAPIQLHPLGSGLTANVGPGVVAILAFPERFGLGYA